MTLAILLTVALMTALCAWLYDHIVDAERLRNNPTITDAQLRAWRAERNNQTKRN